MNNNNNRLIGVHFLVNGLKKENVQLKKENELNNENLLNEINGLKRENDKLKKENKSKNENLLNQINELKTKIKDLDKIQLIKKEKITNILNDNGDLISELFKCINNNFETTDSKCKSIYIDIFNIFNFDILKLIKEDDFDFNKKKLNFRTFIRDEQILKLINLFKKHLKQKLLIIHSDKLIGVQLDKPQIQLINELTKIITKLLAVLNDKEYLDCEYYKEPVFEYTSSLLKELIKYHFLIA